MAWSIRSILAVFSELEAHHKPQLHTKRWVPQGVHSWGPCWKSATTSHWLVHARQMNALTWNHSPSPGSGHSIHLLACLRQAHTLEHSLVSDVWSSCLILLSAGITGVGRHDWLLLGSYCVKKVLPSILSFHKQAVIPNPFVTGERDMLETK